MTDLCWLRQLKLYRQMVIVLTMGRFGKNLDLEKEVVSSRSGTPISIVVKCEAAKTVAKSKSRRGEATSYWKNENVVGPNTWYNEQVELKGGTNLWHGEP